MKTEEASSMAGRPVPAPPPHIAALMAHAGLHHDEIELNRARALYAAWLDDHGYHRDGGRR